jgi:hypothetical protein
MKKSEVPKDQERHKCQNEGQNNGVLVSSQRNYALQMLFLQQQKNKNSTFKLWNVCGSTLTITLA